MRVLLTIPVVALLAFIAPFGEWCANCANSPNHNNGGGELTITTYNEAYISGNCTWQSTECLPDVGCEFTGNIKIKNNAGGEANVTVQKPGGGTEVVGDGNTIDMQVIAGQMAATCGGSAQLQVHRANGQFLGEARFDCAQCPIDP